MDLKKRLKSMVENNKKSNPKYLQDVIKSDFYYIISNYFEVDFKDIDVNIETENNKFVISVNCLGDRIKFINTLP